MRAERGPSSSPNEEEQKATQRLNHEQSSDDGARAALEALSLLSAERSPPPSTSSALADELAPLIELSQRQSSPREQHTEDLGAEDIGAETMGREGGAPLSRARSATVLLSSGAQHLSLRASAWEVLWVTLKLAKVFPRERCEALSGEGGALSVLEMQQIKQHIEQVLFKSMEGGDYLFRDLSLSDLPPSEAFSVGDPRREEHLDRATLLQLTSLTRELKAAVLVRRLQWRVSPTP